MAISGIFNSNAAHGTSSLSKKSTLQQHSTDFSNLANALSSNNLSSAKSAFAALKQGAQSIPATQGSSQANAQTMQKVKSDAQALATTLASGNLGAAQKAFASLKQDSTSARMHFHHHGGTGGSTAASSELIATQAIGSVGSTLNVTA